MLPFSLSRTDADIVNIERKMDKSPSVGDRRNDLYLLSKRHKATSINTNHTCRYIAWLFKFKSQFNIFSKLIGKMNL